MRWSKFEESKSIVIAFLIIIYLPLFLAVCSWVFERTLDIPLSGYTDEIEPVEFTLQNFCTGDFQNKYVKWLDANIKPRGVMIHCYNTLRYNLFRQGVNPIAENGDVLENMYLYEKYCIGSDWDYSIPNNKSNMDVYVAELTEIQRKLLKHGKYLFVYTAPSKADWDYENISKKYINMRDDNSVRTYDYFKSTIEKTNIPYIDCDEIYSSLDYPAFYSTGIHWSRTFEQKASAQIVEKLSELTGKKYRKILLGDVQKSETPFWRDSDVFNNLNIWNKRNETYYEYTAVRDEDDFDKMRILMYGDSFGQGLLKDITDRYPYEDVFFVGYNQFIQSQNAELIVLNQDWNNMDFAYYLDRSDVVVIEMVKPCIGQYSLGFTKALNTALDSYVEGTTLQKHLVALNPSDETQVWDSVNALGLYEKEDGYVWAQKNSQIILDSESISTGSGLEIDYFTPSQLQKQTVKVWINGKAVSEKTYERETNEKIIIPAEQIPDDIKGAFEIEIVCSNSFSPLLLGESSDNRDLAICIRYIGEAR